MNQTHDLPEQVGTQPVQGPNLPAGPKGLTPGRIVHYVSGQGRHFAAIVVNVEHRDSGLSTLAVFEPFSLGVNFYSAVVFDPAGQREYSWHYLEPVE